MATKKDEHDGVFLFLIVPAVLATLVFSLYYFSRLKKQYLTGPHARRIFDIGAQGTSLLVSGDRGLHLRTVDALAGAVPASCGRR